MVKDTKLYTLLGVSPDADESAIKKAYRKQALQYHPDKPTGNEEKFKEISEAFDILSNKEKRELYDQYGLEAARHGQAPMPDFGADGGAGGGGMPGGFPGGAFGGMGGGAGGPRFSFGKGGGASFSTDDAFNIFNAFAGMGGMGGGSRSGMGGGMGGMHGMDDSDDGYSYFGGGGMPGGSKRGGFGGMGGMGGMGGAPPPKPEPLVVKLPVTLHDLYTGCTKKMKIGRRTADGAKEYNILEVNVKPGWKAGTKVTFPNKGDISPSGVAQDVVFEVEEKPDPPFKREGNDLLLPVSLTFKEALLGFTKVIETIDGKKLKISQVNPIRPGSTSRYPGRGMPISKNPTQHGDLILEFKVEFPTSLTPDQRKAIEDNF